MNATSNFDVIIIGGSYAGLAAGMALGRALKTTLIIDSGLPCNRQTPYSHNFITQDGKSPKEIAALAATQVKQYDTVRFFNGLATSARKTPGGFELQTASDKIFHAKKLIFATGIRDLMPAIEGLAACWGISVLHCPYCHGYEVRNEKTGVLGNGEQGFAQVSMLSNWTSDLSLYTNGPSALTPEQRQKLAQHNIPVVEAELEKLEHQLGQLQCIRFKDGSAASLKALYTHLPFEQHCPIPQSLGCALGEEGYIHIDGMQKTSVDGVYACGDSTTRIRTVANAVSSGTTAGVMASKEIILEEF